MGCAPSSPVPTNSLSAVLQASDPRAPTPAQSARFTIEGTQELPK